MPVMRNVRMRITCGGKTGFSRGTSSLTSIVFSSRGGPGSKASAPWGVEMNCPGAVPSGLGRASAPSSKYAWRRLFFAMGRFNWRNLLIRMDSCSSESTSLQPRAAAGDDDIRTLDGHAQVLGEAFAIISQDVLGDDFDAKQIELLGDGERIGIQAIGAEEFRADGENFGRLCHASSN